MAREDLELLDQQTPDPVAQENFDRIRVHFDSSLMDKFDGNVFTIELSGAVTALPIPHLLRFVPTDAWVTFNSGAGAITINYADFDFTNFSLTTTGAINARIVIGSFRSVSQAS